LMGAQTFSRGCPHRWIAEKRTWRPGVLAPIHKTINNRVKVWAVWEIADDLRTASQSDALNHVPHHR
jgi:hypothetical protein